MEAGPDILKMGGILMDISRVVPQDVEIDDPLTADGRRIAQVHFHLYGRESASWREQKDGEPSHGD